MTRNLLFSIVLSSLISSCGTLAPTPPVVPGPVALPPAPARAEAVLQALLALGIDYQYGGASPVTGFDCSGLVAHVYREAWGIRLPHNALAQSESGIPVSLSELQPGDLV